MLAPTVRHYGRRQLYFGWLMVDLARECGRRYGLSEDELAEIEPEFEDLSSRDNVEVATAADLIAGALQVARGEGWIGQEEAGELFRKFCSEPLGVLVERERPEVGERIRRIRDKRGGLGSGGAAPDVPRVTK